MEIKIKDAFYIYPSTHTKVPASPIDIKIKIRPAIYFLKGNNGCGKSTLLKMITGELRYSGGTLDCPIECQNSMEVVYQKGGLFEKVSVTNNLRLAGVKEKKITPLLRRYHLDFHENDYPEELSGGQRVLLQIARCFSSQKKSILILDEPTANLDSRMKAILLEDLLSAINSSKTIICVSHDLDWMERVQEAAQDAVIHLQI